MFARLLDGFRESQGHCAPAEVTPPQNYRDLFETRLKGYLESRAAWAESQKAFADDFNLFSVMGVEYNEVRHSKLLAWLLDRRIDHGTHAQGNLGFRLFLEELQQDLGFDLDYANKPYWVACEVSGDKSRVDIEIAARGEFVIHIENKILSAEGVEQTDREWKDLENRRKELGVREASAHAIFLTLSGGKPKSNHFRSVGWHRVAGIVERFAAQAQAPEVHLFACHYTKAIRSLVISSRLKPNKKEAEDDEEAIS